MLRSLTVKDFALVHELEISFSDGLTVITGESGAGKSILLGALGLVLGERASVDAIRPGAARADVTAEFDLTGRDRALALLEAQSLDDADLGARCLVRRVVNRDGRSRAYVNGTPVTRAVLRQLCEDLIDVHGQHEHQRLTDRRVQLELLDDYGVARPDRQACRDAYRAWQNAAARVGELEARIAAQQDRAGLLRYQLEELEAAGLEAGEFERVEAEHRRLSQLDGLRQTAAESLAALTDSEDLAEVLRALGRADDDHPNLAAARELLTSAQELCADAVRELRAYEDTLEADPESLAEREARLAELHELARKHRVPPERLVDHRDALAEELASLDTDRGALDEWQARARREEEAYRSAADRVGRQRREAADGFARSVSQCLETLGIRGGELRLVFTPAENELGLETVEFHCVTNPRYPAAPLSRVASGGERARIALAIQVVAAERSDLPCLILDEADVGVGGTTADVVGRLLRALATHTQVLCVTHAPQVAALGQHHLRVHKSSDQDTRIEPLAADSRVDELARMLAGADITDKSRDYARTLLSEAESATLH